MEDAVERGPDWTGLLLIATVARPLSPSATNSRPLTPSRGGIGRPLSKRLHSQTMRGA